MAARPSSGVVGGAEYKLSGYLTQLKSYVLGGELTVPDTSGEPKHEHYSPGDASGYVTESDPEHDIVLPTRNKIMDEDLLVKKIRYHEAVNPAGGKTIYIANKDANE